MKRGTWILSLIGTVVACAPPPATSPAASAPPTASSNDAYPASPSDTSSEPTSSAEPATSPEEETTLQFPFCTREMKTQFADKTEGAAFRAIVLFRILPDGKTSEHCYLRVDGAIKWEERALGKVAEWAYPVEFAGEQRERTVTYRLK